jgi:hypothetical protein
MGSVNVRTEPDPLAVAILWDGYPGENFLGSVDGVGWDFANDAADVKRRVLDAIAWLLERELIMLFTVDPEPADGHARRVCVGSTAALVAWLSNVYTNDSDDWDSWAYACWFANTDAGNALARQYPPEPWGDDDE